MRTQGGDSIYGKMNMRRVAESGKCAIIYRPISFVYSLWGKKKSFVQRNEADKLNMSVAVVLNGKVGRHVPHI